MTRTKLLIYSGIVQRQNGRLLTDESRFESWYQSVAPLSRGFYRLYGVSRYNIIAISSYRWILDLCVSGERTQEGLITLHTAGCERSVVLPLKH